MDSQESPLVHHPPQFLQPPLPPHTHGTMVAPPTPPPPQPQPHQEQPSSYILPTNAIFQQPQQHHNLQFPFNSVSGQNPNPNFLDHSDGSSSVAAAGAAAAGVKKKRGRPRKYSADANNGLGVSSTPRAQIPVNHAAGAAGAAAGGVNGAASSENPSKKGRGRPPGSVKKQKQEALGVVGFGFTPHIIHVNPGEDIATKVMTFSLQAPPAVCILSGTGVVSNVTLRKATIGGGTETYEGRFNIISLSGSFLLSERNGNRIRTGGLSVSLSGPDGQVLGGVVAGSLEAASPVQLVVGSFIPEKEKPMSEAPSSTPPPNMLNFSAPITGESSPSPGASSDSADENSGGRTLSHKQAPFSNPAQPMYGMPTQWGQAM